MRPPNHAGVGLVVMQGLSVTHDCRETLPQLDKSSGSSLVTRLNLGEVLFCLPLAPRSGDWIVTCLPRKG